MAPIPGARRAVAALLLCVCALNEVVGDAVAREFTAPGPPGVRRVQGARGRDALQVGGAPVLQVTSNWAAAATGWNRTLAYPTGAVWTRSTDRIGRLVGLTGPQGNDIALNWQGEFYAGRSHSRGGAPALHEIATLDRLGRRVGWDFTAGSTSAYSATATRDVVGRVASLTWAFGPSAADHWRGYGYDPATRLADAWSWDGLAPRPDVSSLANHTVGPGQVATLAAGLAGVVHAPFTRVARCRTQCQAPRSDGRGTERVAAGCGHALAGAVFDPRG